MGLYLYLALMLALGAWLVSTRRASPAGAAMLLAILAAPALLALWLRGV